MKIVQKLFETVRCHFEGDGKLRGGKPLFDAMENFFFGPSVRTSTAPHVRDPLDLKRYMSMVIISLVPSVIMGFYFFGWRLLPMIIVSYAAGGAIEVLFAIVRKEDIAEGFLVTGLIFPLVLPPTLPLWMVGVSVAFGVLVGKEVFGGTGRNLFNPALVGRCFALLAYSKAMVAGTIEPIKEFPGRLLQYVSAADVDVVSEAVAGGAAKIGFVDAVTAATPLGLAKQGLWDTVNLSDLFFGAVSGSAGETCALAIITGGVFLLVTRVGNWRTVVGILGAFVLTTACLHWGEDKLYKLVPWHLCAGGILFGAFFMATDPVSSPMTNGGKWIYGIVIGVVAVLIRNLTGYVEGVMFAILLGNIIAPVLDELVIYVHQRGLRNER